MRHTLTPLLLLGAAVQALGAQALVPPGTGGIPALVDAIERLGPAKRVLVIGAHPDDEDTQLLTLLSRGMGAQAAYLSLTRGEGGQNLIGPELGVELGMLRTEELLAARALDGARQFFTRAYDFGYSRSADETFRHWPRDSLLRDVIAVIRRVRPQVLVSIFSGTPRDGHGHHQAAGLLARQAFDALRDSTWGPVALYRSTRFDTAATTLRLATGTLDPVAGRSYHQIAMASRSLHRSQDMGQLQRLGPSEVHLALVASRRPGAAGGLFAGVDTAPPGAAAYAALVDSARALLNPWRPADVSPLLARAMRALPRSPEPEDQRPLLERALVIAAGIAIDALADDDVVTPAQRLQVEVSAWNTGTDAVRLERVEIAAPAGWTVEALDLAASPLGPGALAVRRFVATVGGPATARRTNPYFLRRPLQPGSALYDWSGVPAAVRGLPFEPPPLEARVTLRIAGEPVTISREVVHRVRDQMLGEVRRPITMTGAFDVTVGADVQVWPTVGAGRRAFLVTVTNRTRGPATGRLAMAVPPGWRAEASPTERLAFDREDETQSRTVTVTPPPAGSPGSYELAFAVVGADGSGESGALRVLDYPHVRPRALARPSAVEIRTAPMELPAVRIGYVRGAADRVPEALRGLGLAVDVIPGDSLDGDLSRYDALVVGSRAYEIDSALVARNARLLDYARGGGLVLVQYQQYDFVHGGYAPARLTIARPHDRVTDEGSPVTLLAPDHPVFWRPNRITAADWEGWVQERGLYFAREWDPAFTPLLELADPGMEPLRGGLLVASVGRGTYVYTGLSFFRQIPSGVPGAYRIFTNLLALGER